MAEIGHKDTIITSTSHYSGDEGHLPDMIPQGWPHLAYIMSITPEFAAFQRFRDLNIKSLLYYQCELNLLREKLNRLETDDLKKGHDYNVHAAKLMKADPVPEQYKMMQEMRVLLKEYNTALLQFTQVSSLPEPEPCNMRTLRKWLRHKQCANFSVQDENSYVNSWGAIVDNPEDEHKGFWTQLWKLIKGLLSIWRPEKVELYMAMTSPRTPLDGFTHWVAAELIPFYYDWQDERARRKEAKMTAEDVEKARKKKESSDTPGYKNPGNPNLVESWSENSVLRFTSGICTVISCLLPIVAISVLSQLHKMEHLLPCLAAFTVVFSVGLIAMTQGAGKRTEIFSATAAFAAVMVVFISQPPAPVINVAPNAVVTSAMQ